MSKNLTVHTYIILIYRATLTFEKKNMSGTESKCASYLLGGRVKSIISSLMCLRTCSYSCFSVSPPSIMFLFAQITLLSRLSNQSKLSGFGCSGSYLRRSTVTWWHVRFYFPVSKCLPQCFLTFSFAKLRIVSARCCLFHKKRGNLHLHLLSTGLIP